MMQKIKMPGTGPPLFQNGSHARGMPVWWRLFPRGHPFATGIFRCIRTDEDVGRPGWLLPNLQGLKRFEEDVCLQGGFLSPNLQGFGNLEGLWRRNKAREPAWPSAGVQSHYPGSIAVGFPEGMAMPSQRTEKAHARTGLQPHSAMRLKPEELVCSSVVRQLKQTAMEEKQPAMVCKDYQPGSIAVGFPEGMAMPSQRIKDACKEAGLQPHSAMRLKPKELVCSSVARQLKQTAMEEKQTAMVCKDYQPGSIAVGLSQRTEKAHARTGLQPHSAMRLKPEELVCSSVVRQLKQTAIKQPAMKEKEIAMDSLYGSPNLEGLGNLEGLWRRNKAREPAWPSAGVQSHNPGSIAVGLSQRTEKAHTRTGLQPHLTMRLKPKELVCSSVARQLKQTAMEEKQPAMVCKDYQPGSIAVGFPEGMAMPSQRIKDACKEAGLQPHSAMRLKPEELVCSSVVRQLKQTAMEEKQPAMVCKDYQPGSIAVGLSQRTEKAHARTGLQPHSAMRLKPEELVCSSEARQLKQTAIKQPAMKEKEIAMDSLYGSPNLEGLGNLEGLKSNCKAREPAGHPPEAVCRSGTPTEACCVHIKMMVRERDGTMVSCRWHSLPGLTVHSNPAGLHVYRKTVNRENSTPAGVAQPVVSYRFYKHLIPLESGKNIPVLRTLGYCAVSYSTNFTGALHLGFQTAGTAIKEPAAAPRNICRTADYSSERKVQRTETLNRNVEYKIRKSEVVPKASLREKSEVVPKASLREKPEVGSWKREARSTKLCRRHPCGGREKMRG